MTLAPLEAVQINGARYFSETALVEALARAYAKNAAGANAVGEVCDSLDRTGGLLGIVRHKIQMNRARL